MYTWTIKNLERNSADNAVIIAHWHCKAVDGEYTASSFGAVGFEADPEAEGFIPFNDLTEETVLGWVKASIGQEEIQAIEANLAEHIEKAKAPAVLNGKPW